MSPLVVMRAWLEAPARRTLPSPSSVSPVSKKLLKSERSACGASTCTAWTCGRETASKLALVVPTSTEPPRMLTPERSAASVAPASTNGKPLTSPAGTPIAPLTVGEMLRPPMRRRALNVPSVM